MNVITVYGNKMNIQLDMYQTLAIAVVVLILGQFLKSKIDFLEKFCIPAPVVGGLLFAIFTCICYATGLAEFSFDDTLLHDSKKLEQYINEGIDRILLNFI